MNLIITALLLRAPQFKRDFDQSEGDHRQLGLGTRSCEYQLKSWGHLALSKGVSEAHNLGPHISVRLSWGMRRRHFVRSQRTELGSVGGAIGRQIVIQ